MRNNNYAQTIYYAASSSLNHYKSTGQLKELQEYMTQGAGKNQTVDSSMVEDMPEEYDGRLYYLTLVPGSADTERYMNCWSLIFMMNLCLTRHYCGIRSCGGTRLFGLLQ